MRRVPETAHRVGSPEKKKFHRQRTALSWRLGVLGKMRMTVRHYRLVSFMYVNARCRVGAKLICEKASPSILRYRSSMAMMTVQIN